MKVIPQFDIETIRKILTDDFPDLKIDSIELINNGWDHVVAEVNHDLIFRFPKDDDHILETETKLLNFLKGKITLEIPKVTFSGKSHANIGYRKISGSDLTHETFQSLNTEQKAKLVFDLANFLKEIHEKVSVDQALALGIKDEDPPAYAHLIKNVLLEKINVQSIADFAKTTLEEYEKIKVNDTEIAFLYNDLHSENMAFDLEHKQLNGIFDFADALVGDINRDFCPLYAFDVGLMKMVAEKYQELTDRKLDFRRMIIYGRINELSDLAEYLIDQPNSKNYTESIARIKKWMNEDY